MAILPLNAVLTTQYFVGLDLKEIFKTFFRNHEYYT